MISLLLMGSSNDALVYFLNLKVHFLVINGRCDIANIDESYKA